MMIREQRAKQFMPFDAMKGLQAALHEREERYSRVDRHDISEEAVYENSRILSRIKGNEKVLLSIYSHFHDIAKEGVVSDINTDCKYIVVDEEKIFFEDIYSIRITDEN